MTLETLLTQIESLVVDYSVLANQACDAMRDGRYGRGEQFNQASRDKLDTILSMVALYRPDQAPAAVDHADLASRLSAKYGNPVTLQVPGTTEMRRVHEFSRHPLIREAILALSVSTNG